MIIIDWRLTLIAVVLMPFLVIVQRRVGQVRARIAGETQESLSELTSITQETLSVSGILLSKSFNRQRTESARYAGREPQPGASAGAPGDERSGLLRGRPGADGERSGGHLPRLGLPDHGRHRRDHRGNDRRVHDRAGATAACRSWASCASRSTCRPPAALFARIFEYLDLVPAIADAPDAIPVSRRARVRSGASSSATWCSAIRMPQPDARPTLRGVSFVAEPGQHVAFVGPSGAGKTTVLYLTPRMYEASGGAVLFAGADVRALTQESIIDEVGIVSQETYLFHATIRENLLYAKPDATEDELEDACRAANIHHIIAGFEDGYDTIVGERGYRLSGGEKQRIAIARVLLKDPPVLLLDEATSALDTVSERVVQEALDAAARGRTTLSIAHRLSTVIGADVIHVVDGGRIVESGTHATLIAQDGLYAELAAQQLAASRILEVETTEPLGDAARPAAPTARRMTPRRCRSMTRSWC